MAVKVTGVENQLGRAVTLLVHKRSKQIVDNYRDRYLSRLYQMGIEWKRQVREKLSVQVPKPWNQTTPRNLSPFPKRRTGKLQGSILRPEIHIRRRTEKFLKSKGKSTVEFTMSNFFGKVAGGGYGETLNRANETTSLGLDDNGRPIPNPRAGGKKPFAGWKERAMRLFYNLIEQRSAF